MKLRIHKFLPTTRVEGPGERACIWVQGCPIRCPGCAQPETWPFDGGYETEVEEIAETILIGPPVEGVTLVGGEPFYQAKALARLGKIMQKNGLSVVTFTGYLYETLCQSDQPGRRELLSVTDLLIDGPFMNDLYDLCRPWVGSSNQRYHFLSPRYMSLKNSIDLIPNRIEVRLGVDGSVFINGMGSMDSLKGMLDSVVKKPLV